MILRKRTILSLYLTGSVDNFVKVLKIVTNAVLLRMILNHGYIYGLDRGIAIEFNILILVYKCILV